MIYWYRGIMKSKMRAPLTEKLYRLNILKKSVTADREKKDTEPLRIRDYVAISCASGLFVGYVPVAQGTLGSLWVPVFYYLLPEFWFVQFFREISLVLLGVILILYFLGVWAAGECEVLWGHDPGRVVIDEIVGLLVTLSFVPLTGKTVWLGFFLFRVFDIIKLPPGRWLEKLPGGWGVMSDDVCAGIYANLCVRVILYFIKVI
jgi:phosphatidylglycerophosphatase A